MPALPAQPETEQIPTNKRNSYGEKSVDNKEIKDIESAEVG